MTSKPTSKIAQAALDTAKYIEKYPDRYNFMINNKPKGPEDCGCVLGWLGYFLGVEDTRGAYTNRVSEALGYPNLSRALDAIKEPASGASEHDYDSPRTAAQLLRAWADQIEEDYISRKDGMQG